MANSISLRELTAKSEQLSGRTIELGRTPETRDADIPFYVSDCQAVTHTTGWMPTRLLDKLSKMSGAGWSMSARSSRQSFLSRAYERCRHYRFGGFDRRGGRASVRRQRIDYCRHRQ